MSVNGIEDVWCRQPETTFDGALLDNVYAYRDRWTLLNFARFNNLSVLIERARVLRLADWLSVIGTDERASLSLSLVEYSLRSADYDEFSDSHHSDLSAVDSAAMVLMCWSRAKQIVEWNQRVHRT